MQVASSTTLSGVILRVNGTVDRIVMLGPNQTGTKQGSSRFLRNYPSIAGRTKLPVNGRRNRVLVALQESVDSQPF